MASSKIYGPDDQLVPYFRGELPWRQWAYSQAITLSGIASAAPPKIVLDAGSSPTSFVPYLVKLKHEVHAINLSGEKQRSGRGATEYNMSMTDLQFPAEFFDYVFCIAALNQVNAGAFSLDEFTGDTGDTTAAMELSRVLKPSGRLILCVDFAKKYIPPPGLWKQGHRIYNTKALYKRILGPGNLKMPEYDLHINLSQLRDLEPRGYDYTLATLVLEKR
jgi:hypothetical protein